MALNIGFTSYDDPEPVPTIAELLASLTGPQRSGILNGFAERTSVAVLKGELSLPSSIILFFYGILKQMEQKAFELMNGQVVINEDPLTYNTPPVDVADLVSQMEPFFTDFTTVQLTAMANKMIAYSKSDGTGDWTWYESKVTAL